MKKIILLIIILISFNTYSQDYPKFELNDRGEKVVVFTLEQAQKIDSDLEILELMKVSRLKCDSLSLSYIKIIDEQSGQIVILKKLNDELQKNQIDKDKQIATLSEQNINLTKNISGCDSQIDNKNKEIDGLNDDIKRVRRRSIASGFASGVVATLVSLLLLQK